MPITTLIFGRDNARGRDSAASDEAVGEILAGLRAGALEGLEELWALMGAELYALGLWRTGSESDAEDAVQDAFVRLARRAGDLRPVRRPRVFVLTLLHRAAVDVVRRRRDTVSIEDVAPRFVESWDSHQRVEARELCARLAELAPAQRTAIYLRHFAELEFREIARITGVPTFTAASRYRLGLARLRKLVGEKP